jgi:hypothetical protein
LKTIYDVISIVMFAGLAIIFLQRSASRSPDSIPIWKYGIPAIGCAVGDYLGNHDQMIASIAIFLAVAGFSIMILRPFR